MTSTRRPTVRITETAHAVADTAKPSRIVVTIHGDTLTFRHTHGESFSLPIADAFRHAIVADAFPRLHPLPEIPQ